MIVRPGLRASRERVYPMSRAKKGAAGKAKTAQAKRTAGPLPTRAELFETAVADLTAMSYESLWVATALLEMMYDGGADRSGHEELRRPMKTVWTNLKRARTMSAAKGGA